MHLVKQIQTKTESELSQWMKRVLQIAIEGVDRGEYPFGTGVFSGQGYELAISCNTVVVTEAGYGSLEMSGSELASQFNCRILVHGRIHGNEYVSLLLKNQKG